MRADHAAGARGVGADGARPLPVRLFCEARLHETEDGTVLAVDASSGASAWQPYLDRLGALELAARVGLPNPGATVPVGDVDVHPMPFYSGPRQLLVRLPQVLAAVWKATGDDAVCLFRLPGTVSLLGAALCRVRRRRYAVEVIGDPAGVLRSGVLGPAGRLLTPACAWVMRWVVRGGATGHFVTERTLQALYPLRRGAPEHSYSNVSLTDEDLSESPRREPRPVRRLIAVGTQDQWYKGHDDLIRALALLRARGFDLRLSLVGDGRHHDALKELARRAGVADRVTFHGRVNSRDELRRLLDEADLFCMPSRTEGLPRALIEALARGLPAVGTDVGGIPELIPPQFCCPPRDPWALAALVAGFVDGTVDVAAAAQAAWERGRDFSPEQQDRRIRAWLDELGELTGSAP